MSRVIQIEGVPCVVFLTKGNKRNSTGRDFPPTIERDYLQPHLYVAEPLLSFGYPVAELYLGVVHLRSKLLAHPFRHLRH